MSHSVGRAAAKYPWFGSLTRIKSESEKGKTGLIVQEWGEVSLLKRRGKRESEAIGNRRLNNTVREGRKKLLPQGGSPISLTITGTLGTIQKGEGDKNKGRLGEQKWERKLRRNYVSLIEKKQATE